MRRVCSGQLSCPGGSNQQNFSQEIVWQQVARTRVLFSGIYPTTTILSEKLQQELFVLAFFGYTDYDGERIFFFPDWMFPEEIFSSHITLFPRWNILINNNSHSPDTVQQGWVSQFLNLPHSQIKIHFSINIVLATWLAERTTLYLMIITQVSSAVMALWACRRVNFLSHRLQSITENFVEITNNSPEKRWGLHSGGNWNRKLFSIYFVPLCWIILSATSTILFAECGLTG